MTDGEIVREYRTAKDKKAQIRIMSELTLKPEEEIIRILKENGCEVEVKRRERKPKAEEKQDTSAKTLGSPRKRRSSSTDKAVKGSSSAEKSTRSSSEIPEGVRIALKEKAEQASYMITAYREKIEECTKIVQEILEYAISIGISEIDLLR